MSRSTADADFAAYCEARWRDLVAGLEREGVRGSTARMAVAEALSTLRPGWARRVREADVDAEAWAAARERAGLPPDEGRLPLAVPTPDAGPDPPGPWLERAGRRSALRRRVLRRRVVRGIVACAVVAGALSWWQTRPEPPPVRAEDNPLPVAWYADGELHLERVVVGLPGVTAFRPVGSSVAVRLGDGTRWLVRPDGELEEPDRPVRFTARERVPRQLSAADFEVMDRTRAADGSTVQVVLYRKGWDSLRVDRYVAIVCRTDEDCREYPLPGRVRFG